MGININIAQKYFAIDCVCVCMWRVTLGKRKPTVTKRTVTGSGASIGEVKWDTIATFHSRQTLNSKTKKYIWKYFTSFYRSY